MNSIIVCYFAISRVAKQALKCIVSPYFFIPKENYKIIDSSNNLSKSHGSNIVVFISFENMQNFSLYIYIHILLHNFAGLYKLKNLIRERNP